MRKYNIKIEDVETNTITELSNANIKTILHTFKKITSINQPIELIRTKSKKIRIAKDLYNQQVDNIIKNF